jgi:hypothetical protein
MFSSPQPPDCPSCLFSRRSNGYSLSFSGLNWLVYESDRSPPASAEVRKGTPITPLSHTSLRHGDYTYEQRLLTRTSSLMYAGFVYCYLRYIKEHSSAFSGNETNWICVTNYFVRNRKGELVIVLDDHVMRACVGRKVAPLPPCSRHYNEFYHQRHVTRVNLPSRESIW